MKKLLSVLLTVILALTMLCSVSAVADGEKVLRLPTFYIGENLGSTYFVPAVERFNEANKGKYRVELEELAEGTYSDKIIQLYKAGKAPVLVQGVLDVLVDAGAYYPMNEWLEQHPDIRALCLEGSVEYCTQENGDIISVPIVALSNMGSFYNSALYNPDKPITQMTVDEFVESLGDNKLALMTSENAWTSMLFFTALIANEEGGAELLQKYDGYKLYDLHEEPIMKAAEKLQSIFMNNAAASSIGAAYADAANTFMSGNAAVIFNGAWMDGEFAEGSSDKWSGDFNGANVKADYFPGNVAIASSVAGYGRWAVTKGGTDDEREVALAFLEFIYSQEELEAFALIEGTQIPNLEYSEKFLAALDSNPLVKAQTELVTKDTVLVPNFGGILVDSVSGNVFGVDLVQLATGAITPEQFIDDLTLKSQEANQD